MQDPIDQGVHPSQETKDHCETFVQAEVLKQLSD